MIYSVNEPIKAIVLFEGPKIKPLRFLWRGVAYPVKEVTYTWKNREGRALVYHFAVTDGLNVFQLRYQTESPFWEIESIDLER